MAENILFDALMWLVNFASSLFWSLWDIIHANPLMGALILGVLGLILFFGYNLVQDSSWAAIKFVFIILFLIVAVLIVFMMWQSSDFWGTLVNFFGGLMPR